MTSPGGPVVAGGAAGKHGREPVSPAESRGRQFDGRQFNPGPWWMRALPPAVMLVVALIGITTPSFWRDEAATLASVRRPFGDLIVLLGHIDAVHGAYYALMVVVTRLFGYGELALRLPSALAMCVAAGFVAALGRRLVSPAAGLASGLLFAAIPQVSFYGQDARPYAFVTAAAAIASYLLVRALAAPPVKSRRWWAGYALSLALVGVLNIFALLLIAAHAVTVAVRLLRPGSAGPPGPVGPPGPAGGQSRPALARRWLIAAIAGIVVSGPQLAFGWRERNQVSWLKPQTSLHGMNQLIGPMNMLIAVVVIVAAGLAVSAVAGRARLAATWPAGLAGLAVPWLVLPPLLLLAGSQITPMYTFRYVLFCVPAAALIGGTALAAIAAARPARAGWLAAAGWFAAAGALVLIAALGLHDQASVRRPAGHKDNIRRADHIIAVRSRPGDAVMYTNYNAESLPDAYPFGLDKLHNIALARQAIPSGTLGGTLAPNPVIRRRLAGVSRLWVVNVNTNHIGVPVLDGLNYHLAHTYRTSDIWLRLYVRSAGAG